MPPISPKQEQFALYVVAGLSPEEAYAKAYPRAKPERVQREAPSLMALPSVASRIAKLRALEEARAEAAGQAPPPVYMDRDGSADLEALDRALMADCIATLRSPHASLKERAEARKVLVQVRDRLLQAPQEVTEGDIAHWERVIEEVRQPRITEVDRGRDFRGFRDVSAASEGDQA